jgi:hypothetical protein
MGFVSGFREVFSSTNGRLSSKRFALGGCMFVFYTSCLANLFYGKLMDTGLQYQLTGLIMYLFTGVAGEAITNAKALQIGQRLPDSQP